MAILRDEIRDGTNLMITGQRRMGKTSLVREAFRRLHATQRVTTLFVDLEDAKDPADAVVRIVAAARSKTNVWQRTKGALGEGLKRLEAVGVGEFKISLRTGINAGSWKYRGDALLDAIARHRDRRVVIALDEQPLVVNRILVDEDYQMPMERIVGWSVRHDEHVLSFHLAPWSRSTASMCLGELSRSYDLDRPAEVRRAMCLRLRLCVPHHVQQFFDALHRVIRFTRRSVATLEDAERPYRNDMLGTRGRMDMDYFEERLKLVLGPQRFRIALELLARTAGQRSLGLDAIGHFQTELGAVGEGDHAEIPFVLDVLEHDGYLAKNEKGEYRFQSGVLEDWQRARNGLPFPPFVRPQTEA